MWRKAKVAASTVERRAKRVARKKRYGREGEEGGGVEVGDGGGGGDGRGRAVAGWRSARRKSNMNRRRSRDGEDRGGTGTDDGAGVGVNVGYALASALISFLLVCTRVTYCVSAVAGLQLSAPGVLWRVAERGSGRR